MLTPGWDRPGRSEANQLLLALTSLPACRVLLASAAGHKVERARSCHGLHGALGTTLRPTLGSRRQSAHRPPSPTDDQVPHFPLATHRGSKAINDGALWKP